MLWHIQIEPAPGHADRIGSPARRRGRAIGRHRPVVDCASRGFLIEGEITEAELGRAAREVLVDLVVETHTIRPGRADWDGPGTIVHVLPKPGVTDPEAESALGAFEQSWLCSLQRTHDPYLSDQRAAREPPSPGLASAGQRRGRAGSHWAPPLRSARRRTPLSIRARPGRHPGQNDRELIELSRAGQLALSLGEMKAIQQHFALLGRDPTDCELETLAQTWSEHCSHKTLRGRIAFQGAPLITCSSRRSFARLTSWAATGS